MIPLSENTESTRPISSRYTNSTTTFRFLAPGSIPGTERNIQRSHLDTVPCERIVNSSEFHTVGMDYHLYDGCIDRYAFETPALIRG